MSINMKNTKYINFLGGPGTGKSTSAAELFVKMKQEGYDVELVTEVAKDFVWENRSETLSNQPYVTSKQFRNLYRLHGKVDYVVTDASVLNGLIYSENKPSTLHPYILSLHNEMLTPSFNILLDRVVKYDHNGRLQTQQNALSIDTAVKKMLSLYNINHKKLNPLDIKNMSVLEILY